MQQVAAPPLRSDSDVSEVSDRRSCISTPTTPLGATLHVNFLLGGRTTDYTDCADARPRKPFGCGLSLASTGSAAHTQPDADRRSSTAHLSLRDFGTAHSRPTSCDAGSPAQFCGPATTLRDRQSRPSTRRRAAAASRLTGSPHASGTSAQPGILWMFDSHQRLPRTLRLKGLCR